MTDAAAFWESEFKKMRDIVHQYRDQQDKAFDDAQSIVRPYLQSGSVYGVQPDHRFREIHGLPLKLVEDITAALMKAEAKGATAQREADARRASEQATPFLMSVAMYLATAAFFGFLGYSAGQATIKRSTFVEVFDLRNPDTYQNRTFFGKCAKLPSTPEQYLEACARQEP